MDSSDNQNHIQENNQDVELGQEQLVESEIDNKPKDQRRLILVYIATIVLLLFALIVGVSYYYFSKTQSQSNSNSQSEIVLPEKEVNNQTAVEKGQASKIILSEEEIAQLKYKELFLSGSQMSMLYPENWNVYDLNEGGSLPLNKAISPTGKDSYSKIGSGIRILGQGSSIISGAEEWEKLKELANEYYGTVKWEHSGFQQAKQQKEIEIAGIKMLKTELKGINMRNDRMDTEYEKRNLVYYNFNINTSFLVLEYSYSKDNPQMEEIYKKMIESIKFNHIEDKNYKRSNISDDVVRYRSKNDADYEVDCDNISKSGFGLSPASLVGLVFPGEKINPSIWILKRIKEEASVFEYSLRGNDIVDFISIEDGFVYNSGDDKTQIIFNIDVPQDINLGVYTGVIEIKEMCQQLSARVEVELTVIDKEVGSADDYDGDNLSNEDEIKYNTDISNPDTDGDGYLDGDEVKDGFDPTVPGELSNLLDTTITESENKNADIDPSTISDFIENSESPGITINKVAFSQSGIQLTVSGYADTICYSSKIF